MTMFDTTPTTTPLQRAEGLLAQMTLDEKVMQLSAIMPIGLVGPDGPIEPMLVGQLGAGMCVAPRRFLADRRLPRIQWRAGRAQPDGRR